LSGTGGLLNILQRKTLGSVEDIFWHMTKIFGGPPFRSHCIYMYVCMYLAALMKKLWWKSFWLYITECTKQPPSSDLLSGILVIMNNTRYTFC